MSEYKKELEDQLKQLKESESKTIEERAQLMKRKHTPAEFEKVQSALNNIQTMIRTKKDRLRFLGKPRPQFFNYNKQFIHQHI